MSLEAVSHVGERIELVTLEFVRADDHHSGRGTTNESPVCHKKSNSFLPKNGKDGRYQPQ